MRRPTRCDFLLDPKGTWETTYFVGVSVDLRAAVQMLKVALVTK